MNRKSTLQDNQGASGRRINKSSKGTAKIENDKGWLRIRFTHQQKRYAFALGLPDTQLNRKVAADKAHKIELDILSDNFDATLEKYKSLKNNHKSSPQFLTGEDIIQRFIDRKAKTVSTPRSLEKYQTVLKYLQNFQCKDGNQKISLADLPLNIWTETHFEEFYEHLSKKLSPLTLKQYLVWLSAIWQWGIAEKMIKQEDPWLTLINRVKVPPKQMPKPFNRAEIHKIINGFEHSKYYSHYTDFVKFLFGTGCRTGEAIGLRWQHLNDDCSTVWIGESLSRGIRKATKTNRARTITLTPKLQKILGERRPDSFNPEALVFGSPLGNPIDDHNFRNRAWKSILNQVNVEYRKPYNTRHTLISHALDQGMSPVTVAQLTGHDVQTLYENYAGNVKSRPMLPEF
ncbi:tyrosine-type recombinase/integrase [Gloeocapsa sp. PCC 73106]|uniref:tyrosine-type recombinase/integrase n=1 Tax=Gloeocapsa sp. PCC 73106 TaxID=102232 RepID=UPI0002ABF9AA|nr:tyrosine-type recombinase/integrase [Gloeocapsa sp. PCC 73106]ELR97394.1 site-specific recombinase XerD [Gloeocapsa sp. PCC 73106]